MSRLSVAIHTNNTDQDHRTRNDSTQSTLGPILESYPYVVKRCTTSTSVGLIRHEQEGYHHQPQEEEECVVFT
ncbi:hypothetical protein ID160_25440 [Citrobacter braakii]|uniref:Uncharacterized protein n=1 Tax=Citrobacter braakii TaxID=57706 RepID=A0A8I0G5P4_CITBR|nr:hypothetical protein [Citrobacter braakii]